MANVLNRTTKQLIYSVNTPDYPTQIWIVNPDLTSVAGVPQKYWKITGNNVSEMNQSEKNVVDAALNANISFSGVGMQVATFSDSRVGSDQYISVGNTVSDTSGILFPVGGTLRHISVQWSNTPSDFSVNIRKNGIATNLYTINPVGTSKQLIANDIPNVNLFAGDYMQVYINGIETVVRDLVVAVWFELSTT